MIQAKGRKTAVSGPLIGYARVSTEEQGTDPQLDELRAAGCAAVHEEHASGADRTRPVLARLLRDLGPGETLVVVRLDRQSGRNCAPRLRRRTPRARLQRRSPVRC
jgi:DNA invertase Pin-like site-specific DNA recombinase